MLHGSALSFCLRMHQVIRPVYKLKPIKHSIPSSFLHSIYFNFLFFSLSVTISVTYRNWFHVPLSSNPLFLTQPYLITCKNNISNIIIHRIRYLPFFPCLQSEIDGLYQNIYSQTFIEQNQERNTKGTVHEIPGIFCCRNCVCIYYCCRQPENFPGKLNSGSNSQACRR